MWVIVEIGKKQYRAREGDILSVERLKGKGKLSFEKVLLFCKNDIVEVGTPYVKGVKVNAEILEEKKGTKIIVYKYKRRKKYRRKRGHRQFFTRLKISNIIKSK